MDGAEKRQGYRWAISAGLNALLLLPLLQNAFKLRYKAEFPIFDKVDVNGENTAPVYKFLKSSAGGFLGDLIKSNFKKFLVDNNTKVVERYPPTKSPSQIECAYYHARKYGYVLCKTNIKRMPNKLGSEQPYYRSELTRDTMKHGS